MILGSNCFLATEVSFQNDIRETVTADAAFKTALDTLKADTGMSAFATAASRLIDDLDSGAHLGGSTESGLLENARFIVCASADSDSLYAWRTYGSASSIGCAVGLDPEVPLSVIATDTSRAYQVSPWLPVIYEPNRIAEFAVEHLAALGAEWNRQADGTEEGHSYAFGLLVDNLSAVRSQVRAIAKDQSFADERERRLTVEGLRRDTPLSFTSSAMGPRPHVRVAVAGAWGEPVMDAAQAPRLPIRAIKLGPGAPSIAETSLHWMLMAHGYSLDPQPADEGHGVTWEETVLILRSEHPYRSR